LLEYFEANDVKVQGIRCYGGKETKLRWGEAIPLWYMQKYVKNDPRYIILTNDSLPKTGSLDIWRLHSGSTLARFLKEIPEKVVVVISGDLAHYHFTDCTDELYLPDPPGSMPVNEEGAKSFEDSIVKWVKSGPVEPDGKTHTWQPSEALPHLAAAMAIDPEAGACGAKGFALLHGLLTNEVDSGSVYKSEVIVHKVPTYYGMMAATFVKKL